MKIKVDENQYMAELNFKLKQHEMYEEGMMFVPFPKGATGSDIQGYSTTRPFHLTGIYAQVAYSVNEAFFF